MELTQFIEGAKTGYKGVVEAEPNSQTARITHYVKLGERSYRVEITIDELQLTPAHVLDLQSSSTDDIINDRLGISISDAGEGASKRRPEKRVINEYEKYVEECVLRVLVKNIGRITSNRFHDFMAQCQFKDSDETINKNVMKRALGRLRKRGVITYTNAKLGWKLTASTTRKLAVAASKRDH